MPRSFVRRLLAVFMLLALPGMAASRQGSDFQVAEDEKLVRAFLPSGAKLDAAALRAFFDKLTLSEADQKRIKGLIDKLNAESFKEREKASGQLIAEGLGALPLLQKMQAGATLEQTKRLERCIAAIQRPGWNDAISAGARLLVHHGPKEAAQALLAFMPFVPGDAQDEVIGALSALSTKEGKVDPAVMAALKSMEVNQRSAAAVLVGAHGTAEQRKTVLPLLDDADAWVRFRAAQGLLAGREKAALPVLVDLLKVGPAELADTADGMLQEVAGATAPKVEWKNNKEYREKAHAAWLEWWQEHKDKVEIPKADQAGLWVVNAERMAKDVGVKLWLGLAGIDKVTLRKLAAVPFRWGDGRVFETQDELHQLINSQKVTPDLIKMYSFDRVVPAKEFAKVARQEYKAFLDKLQGGRFYVVCMNPPGGNSPNQIGLVVRVRGATARAIGVVASG
jgi:hypothetical protein